MRLDVLRYLADIDETHSISATAERFFIAQPAVSNAIMNFRKIHGSQAFETQYPWGDAGLKRARK